MNHQAITSYVITIALVFFLMIPLLSIVANGYEFNTYKTPDSYDLYTVADQIQSSRLLYIALMQKGFVDTDVSFDDFDYICVLTQQLCQSTKHVTPEIALAMIAVESGFDAMAKNGNARGLMQLIPRYHYDRMSYFVDDPNNMTTDDFYNPRLNIAAGIDYLDSILDATDENINYSLMWYNQGPTSASKNYLDDHHISSYAKSIVNLSAEIRLLLKGGAS